jgi:hypothetical protein
MKTIKLCLVVGAALAFAACGPGAKIGNDKQGAAEALFAASGPSVGSTDAVPQPINITLQGEKTVSCLYGGTATFKNFSIVTDSGSAGGKFTLAYDHCGATKSSQGVATFDGSFDVTQSIVTTNSSADLQQSFKGKVTVGGAFDDFLQADITESIDATKLSATSGSVVFALTGSLADSSGSYTFNQNESVTVAPGNLSVKLVKQ